MTLSLPLLFLLSLSISPHLVSSSHPPSSSSSITTTNHTHPSSHQPHNHNTSPYSPPAPLHIIARAAPEKPSHPICCLKPLKPRNDEEEEGLLLSFEDWKARVEGVHSQQHSQQQLDGRKGRSAEEGSERVNSSSSTTGSTSGREEGADAACNDSSSSSNSSSNSSNNLNSSAHSNTQSPHSNSNSPDTDSSSPSQHPPTNPPLQSHLLTDRFNYASLDCSARVHSAHKSSKSANSILSSKRDRYMLSPCSLPNSSSNSGGHFVVVELCEDIRIDTVQLANFEFFSGVFKDLTVWAAKTHPVAVPGGTGKEGWTKAGTYRAKNVRGVQSFHTPTLHDFYRYIRIDFHSHYGNEYYCPVSLLRVFGFTHLESYKMEAMEALRIEESGRGFVVDADLPLHPEGVTLENSQDVQDEGTAPVAVDPKHEVQHPPLVLEDSSSPSQQSSPSPTPTQHEGTSTLLPPLPHTESTMLVTLTLTDGVPSTVLATAIATVVVPTDAAGDGREGEEKVVGEKVMSSATFRVAESAATGGGGAGGVRSEDAGGVDDRERGEASSAASSSLSVSSAMASSSGAVVPSSSGDEEGSGRASSAASTTPVGTGTATPPTESTANTPTTSSPDAASSVQGSSTRLLSMSASGSGRRVPVSARSSSTSAAAAGYTTVTASTAQHTHHSSVSHKPPPSSSHSHHVPNHHPPHPHPHPHTPSPITGESIYRTIMNRLSALEYDTALFARFAEDQSAGVREVVRRYAEELGRVEGLGKAQYHSVQRMVGEWDAQRMRMEREVEGLVARVEYLADEITLERRLNLAQLCLLLTVLVFLGVTRGSSAQRLSEAQVQHSAQQRPTALSTPALSAPVLSMSRRSVSTNFKEWMRERLGSSASARRRRAGAAGTAAAQSNLRDGGVKAEEDARCRDGELDSDGKDPRSFVFPSAAKREDRDASPSPKIEHEDCSCHLHPQDPTSLSSPAPSGSQIPPSSSSTTLVPSCSTPRQQDGGSSTTPDSSHARLDTPPGARGAEQSPLAVASGSASPLYSPYMGHHTHSSHRPSRLNLGSITNFSRERDSRSPLRREHRDRSTSLGRTNSSGRAHGSTASPGGSSSRLVRTAGGGGGGGAMKLARTRTRTLSGGNTHSSPLRPHSAYPHAHTHSHSHSHSHAHTGDTHARPHTPSSSSLGSSSALAAAFSPTNWASQYHAHSVHSGGHGGPRSARRWARSAHLHHVKRTPVSAGFATGTGTASGTGTAAGAGTGMGSSGGVAAATSTQSSPFLSPFVASSNGDARCAHRHGLMGNDDEEEEDVFGRRARIDLPSTPSRAGKRPPYLGNESVSPVLSNGGTTDGWVDTDGDTEDESCSERG